MKENIYWNHKGNYQALSEKFANHVPPYGETFGPIELYRCMGRIYYDWYNNGFCNFYNLTDFFETLNDKGNKTVKTLATNIQTSFPDGNKWLETDCECDGGYYYNEEEVICPDCNGAYDNCNECDRGYVWDEVEEECWECGGSGLVEVRAKDNWFYADDYLTKSKYEQVEKWLEDLADNVIIQVDHELRMGHWV